MGMAEEAQSDHVLEAISEGTVPDRPRLKAVVSEGWNVRNNNRLAIVFLQVQ